MSIFKNLKLNKCGDIALNPEGFKVRDEEKKIKAIVYLEGDRVERAYNYLIITEDGNHWTVNPAGIYDVYDDENVPSAFDILPAQKKTYATKAIMTIQRTYTEYFDAYTEDEAKGYMEQNMKHLNAEDGDFDEQDTLHYSIVDVTEMKIPVNPRKLL